MDQFQLAKTYEQVSNRCWKCMVHEVFSTLCDKVLETVIHTDVVNFRTLKLNQLRPDQVCPLHLNLMQICSVP